MGTQRPDELPLADYDQLAIGALEHRVRSLSSTETGMVLRYEQEHANRPGVVQVLSTRLDQLKHGSTPSPGDPNAGVDHPTASRAGSPVSPRTAAQPASSPPHGTPDQPAKPKGDRF